SVCALVSVIGFCSGNNHAFFISHELNLCLFQRFFYSLFFVFLLYLQLLFVAGLNELSVALYVKFVCLVIVLLNFKIFYFLFIDCFSFCQDGQLPFGQYFVKTAHRAALMGTVDSYKLFSIQRKGPYPVAYRRYGKLRRRLNKQLPGMYIKLQVFDLIPDMLV